MKKFGVYECVDENMDVVYIGSTSLKLEWLENNHRNWQEKNYSGTDFRLALVAVSYTHLTLPTKRIV